jgi:colanic acid biosynthesis glycosyl transferase WcaI
MQDDPLAEPPGPSSTVAGRRIVFVEQFYYPDGWGGAELPLDLTVHLARAGFAVEVICGSDQYAPLEGKPPPDPRGQGVRIRRVPALFGGDIHRFKLLRQVWFYLALVPLLLRARPDLFVAQTNPPLGVVLIAAAAFLWRRPLVVIAMDIYPEVVFAHGAAGSRSMLGKVLTRVFDWAYGSARRVVALGPVMRERLAAKGVSPDRIVEIPNWATGSLGLVPGPLNPLRTEWNLRDEFVVLYSGNLGFAHEFETLLSGLREVVKAVPAVRLVFIGRGSRLAEVRQRVAELGLEAVVRFSDLLPAGRLPESFGLAQLAVVTLQPAFAGLVVPSKLQGYMGRGVPTLYIGPDSDVDRFIRRSEGGICVREGDVRGVAEALAQLASDPARLATLGRNAREFYEKHFDRAHGLASYSSVVDSVIRRA